MKVIDKTVLDKLARQSTLDLDTLIQRLMDAREEHGNLHILYCDPYRCGLYYVYGVNVDASSDFCVISGGYRQLSDIIREVRQN